jgi:hypothetical protein
VCVFEGWTMMATITHLILNYQVKERKGLAKQANRPQILLPKVVYEARRIKSNTWNFVGWMYDTRQILSAGCTTHNQPQTRSLYITFMWGSLRITPLIHHRNGEAGGWGVHRCQNSELIQLVFADDPVTWSFAVGLPHLIHTIFSAAWLNEHNSFYNSASSLPAHGVNNTNSVWLVSFHSLFAPMALFHLTALAFLPQVYWRSRGDLISPYVSGENNTEQKLLKHTHQSWRFTTHTISLCKLLN